MENPTAVIEEAKERKMTAIINSVTNPEKIPLILDLRKGNETFFYTCVGFHPQEINEFTEEEINRLIMTIKSMKYDIVGIGEIGLDYKEPADYDKMKNTFNNFVDLAIELCLPIVIHTRNGQERQTAFTDTFRILAEKNLKGVNVILHCFSGSYNDLEYAIKQGYYISLATNVCYSKKHAKLAAKVPLENLLLETDSPWLDPETPQGENRGMKNRPWKILNSAAKISEIKGITIDKIIKETTKNANRAYRLNPEVY